MRKKMVLETGSGPGSVTVVVDEMYNVGYAGRDQSVVRAHVEELAAMGVAVPKHVPTIYPVTSTSLTTDTQLEVAHDKTSGEVEYVLFLSEGKKYISVGSDHSDRDLEVFSVPLAKLICPNVVAEGVWDYDEVRDHFDRIEMRAYVTKDGKRELYQDGTLAELMSPEQQMEKVEQYLGRLPGNAVIYSGTLPTKNGLVYGERFEFEMFDPVLGRRLAGAYDLKRLPDPQD